mgnify:CR=1 FL=1
MSSLEIATWTCVAVCFATWLTSVITKEYSWVDRIWSIVPFIYLWEYAAGNGFDLRHTLMAVVATLWGARLTFNFARKGGYAKGGEDYRWAILRERMSPALYQVFNIFFIVIFQNFLLLGITVPAFFAPAGGDLTDYAWAALFLAFLAFETIADQQQWNFHQLKKAGKAQGFLSTGLFSVSRHPNFFAEQAQWWVLYFWSAAAVAMLINWWVVGAVLLSALFAGSLRFTEEISAAKYPDYAAYQKRVSPLIPWFAKR